jgi:hypothetical protein
VDSLTLPDINDFDCIVAQRSNKESATLSVEEHVIDTALNVGHDDRLLQT